MSSEPSVIEGAAYVHLFQQAHVQIQVLERLDEQLRQLAVKRQELQHELGEVRSELNEEFAARLKPGEQLVARARAAIAASLARPNRDLSGRFAAESIASTE